MVLDSERKIVGGNRGRHIWDKGAPRQHGGNKVREEVYTRSLHWQDRLSHPTDIIGDSRCIIWGDQDVGRELY